MSENVFVVRDPTRPLCEENLLHVSIDPAQESTVRCVAVACLATEASLKKGAPAIADLSRRVLSALEDFMPFVKEHIKLVDCPWEPLPGAAWKRGYEAMDPVYSWNGPSTLELTALPLRTPIKNVFFAGRQVAPGLGLEGEFHVGATIARLIRKASDKKEFLD
jgi:phytoene dehydrogenase-like protein